MLSVEHLAHFHIQIVGDNLHHNLNVETKRKTRVHILWFQHYNFIICNKKCWFEGKEKHNTISFPNCLSDSWEIVLNKNDQLAQSIITKSCIIIIVILLLIIFEHMKGGSCSSIKLPRCIPFTQIIYPMTFGGCTSQQGINP